MSQDFESSETSEIEEEGETCLLCGGNIVSLTLGVWECEGCGIGESGLGR